ncbi:MAG: hypothetical protein HKN33_00340 [Pyrinomonadaceae bacterium]|nr:hypothetical protein [Pyrinomonadaceae bacterium]
MSSIKKNYERLRILIWTARILSVLSIFTLLMFFVGEEFDPAKISPRQWIGFMFFPVGLVVGLIVAWKNELLGGSIALFSLLAFYFVYGLILSGSLPIGSAFLLFAIPALVFVAAGIIGRSVIGKAP